MDWVTWAAAGAGAFAGIIGAITGAVGVRKASKANSIAQEALQAAKAANEFAAEANTISRESNRIAVDANELSEHANTISERSALLQSERNDVSWDYDWVGPGLMRVTNTGQDEALWVRVRVTCWDEAEVAERDSVDAGGFIELEFPGERDEELAHQREVAEYEERETRTFPRVRPFRPTPRVSGRVIWQTPLGGHRSSEF